MRLGACVDTILSRHDYPDPVSEALAQALALTSMLSAALKPGGKLAEFVGKLKLSDAEWAKAKAASAKYALG